MDINFLLTYLLSYNFNLKHAFIHYIVDAKSIEYTEQYPYQSSKVLNEIQKDLVDCFKWYVEGGSKIVAQAFVDNSDVVENFFKLRALQASCGEKSFDMNLYKQIRPTDAVKDQIDATLDSLKELLPLKNVQI